MPSHFLGSQDSDLSNTNFTNPKVKNPQFNTYPKHLPIDNFIQRGYLRLLGENLAAVGTQDVVEGTQDTDNVHAKAQKLGAKLDFQFNPNQLTRSVTARTDTQLWINQSPSMLLQPGIGDMTFGWQMLFNREAEVQNNYIDRRQRQAWGLEQDGWGNQIDRLIETYGGGAPEVAARIGVLADIMVLDTITGQKLTQETYDFSVAYAESLRNDIPTDEDAATTTNVTGQQRETLLQANMTNAAFLIPNPIRAVFSENFMVDGYVNQVTVSLQKFSPEMVPTVAFVDISMHAIYQGFTRKSTVFTALQGAHLDDPFGGVDPAGGESQNRIADDVNDESHELQQLGYTGVPILAGFDHSPADTGSKWNPWSGDAATQLVDHRATGAQNTTTTLSGGLKGGNSLPCQVGKSGDIAISYAICSELNKSDLGRHLANHPQREEFRDLILPRLGINIWVGMALRARLKADDIDDLKVLWENGGEGGFADYVKTDHFFGQWSVEQRKALFAIGIDNMLATPYGAVPRLGSNLIDFTRASQQSSGFFTRSFPITELAAFPGHYGDEFYRHRGTFDNTEINIKFADSPTFDPDGGISGSSGSGWIWAPDKTGRSISAPEFQYNLARGFYNSSSDILPDTLTLDGSPDVEFDVEYQWATTYRVRLLMDDHRGILPISDTGVIWVYGRKQTTDIIDDIDDGWFGGGHDEKNKQLAKPWNSSGVQGTQGSNIVEDMKDGYWLTGSGAKDTELYFDDLYGSGQESVNSKLYAAALAPGLPINSRLGGMSISSDEVFVNMTGTAST